MGTARARATYASTALGGDSVPSRKPSITERVEADLRAGDFASARSRLISHLNTCGYDAALVERVGRICADMHDPPEAGRFWLLADVEGPEVEAAIDRFLRNVQGCVTLRRLPHFARRTPLADYPPRVRERLTSLNISEALRESTKPAGKNRWRHWADAAIGIGMMLGIAAMFIVGAVTIIRWFIFGGSMLW